MDGLKDGLASVGPDSVLGEDILDAAIFRVEWHSLVLEVTVHRNDWWVSLNKVDPGGGVQHSVTFNGRRAGHLWWGTHVKVVEVGKSSVLSSNSRDGIGSGSLDSLGFLKEDWAKSVPKFFHQRVLY